MNVGIKYDFRFKLKSYLRGPRAAGSGYSVSVQIYTFLSTFQSDIWMRM